MTDAPGERLESWKKIAAHLRRDVRTVQRWEQSNGLPVHRHKRAQRSLPFAYKKELDAWWAAQSDLEPPAADSGPSADAPPPGRRRLGIAAALVLAAIAAGFSLFKLLGDSPAPPRSVAVLPFIDLSEGMVNEEFADGVTEELIDRLNKIPGLRVPAPTSTFFYKNKQVQVAEIGRSLGVAYVLDGSVRKSGERVRVGARLIRAADSAVIWSESYERPWSDFLALQDDIAGEVSRALERSLSGAPN
jgi:transcriptional activator of cad operon